ncbi:hypothetical protein L1987_21159 [Smallanthus sonchifolius]|uniref:Uncharacterized protein n=1 Tax=Smallanthus sonchifolius TaxID=185202 RepID=A0ACB9IVA7_9ASTR|nr:hypothetical protein L1987_21159 [Smallanthus sonchifolius]
MWGCKLSSVHLLKTLSFKLQHHPSSEKARKSSRLLKRKAFKFTNKPENPLLLDEEEEISIVPDSENTDPDEIIISTLKKTKKRKLFNDSREELLYVDSYSCVGLNEERTKSPIEIWTTESLKLREDLELERGGFGLGEYRGQYQHQINEGPGETENLTDKITEIESKLDYFREVKKKFELELAEIFYRNKENLGVIRLLENYETMLADKPNWSDIIVEKEFCDHQDIVATMKISNVLNELNETFEISNMTEKGRFGEDIDIEDGLIGEHTERSEVQQAGERGAKVCEGEKEKKDGKDIGGLENMQASSFSVGVTQKTYANKDKPDEMRLDVHEEFEQSETCKEKGRFGEDIDIEDGLISEYTERSEVQQAGETGAKVCEGEKEKKDGKDLGGLENMQASIFSVSVTQKTYANKGVEEEEYEMPADVDHETGKGVEEEEYEMPVDVDHESVNQDLEAGKDNLIEEMELKTSSESINCQRLTGRSKVASEALRSPYLVREVYITKSMTKEDEWVWKFIWTDPKKIDKCDQKDEKVRNEEKSKDHEIIEYVFY